MIGDGVGEMGDDLAAVNLGTGLTAKSVACGQYHTCAVLSDDTLKCWGSNFEGLLGEVTTFYDEDDDNDDDNDREDYTIGNGAGEMGDNLARVNLGTDRTVSTLALCANGFTACALLDDLSVKCWGGDGEIQACLETGRRRPPMTTSATDWKKTRTVQMVNCCKLLFIPTSRRWETTWLPSTSVPVARGGKLPAQRPSTSLPTCAPRAPPGIAITTAKTASRRITATRVEKTRRVAIVPQTTIPSTTCASRALPGRKTMPATRTIIFHKTLNAA